jgi:hypothetical protein
LTQQSVLTSFCHPYGAPTFLFGQFGREGANLGDKVQAGFGAPGRKSRLGHNRPALFNLAEWNFISKTIG